MDNFLNLRISINSETITTENDNGKFTENEIDINLEQSLYTTKLKRDFYGHSYEHSSSSLSDIMKNILKLHDFEIRLTKIEKIYCIKELCNKHSIPENIKNIIPSYL